jgi:hypothetical protein
MIWKVQKLCSEGKLHAINGLNRGSSRILMRGRAEFKIQGRRLYQSVVKRQVRRATFSRQ